MLVTENAEGRGAEKEMLRLPHRQSDPTRGQDAPEVAMREDGNVSSQRAETGNHTVSAVGNLGRRFTTRTSVSKKIPVRSLRSQLGPAPPRQTGCVRFCSVVVRRLRERRARVPQRRRVSAERACASSPRRSSESKKLRQRPVSAQGVRVRGLARPGQVSARRVRGLEAVRPSLLCPVVRRVAPSPGAQSSF